MYADKFIRLLPSRSLLCPTVTVVIASDQ